MLSYGGFRIMNIYENERNFNELAHGQYMGDYKPWVSSEFIMHS